MRYDGKRVPTTNTDLPAREVALKYKQLCLRCRPATDPEAENGTGARGRAQSTAFTADSAQHDRSSRPAIPSPTGTFRTKPTDFAVTERYAAPPTSMWLHTAFPRAQQ